MIFFLVQMALKFRDKQDMNYYVRLLILPESMEQDFGASFEAEMKLIFTSSPFY